MAKTSRRATRKVADLFALLAMLLNGLLVGSAPAGVAHAAPSVIFAVDSTLDLPDFNPGDGACATAPRPRSVCTLRAAIMEADSTTPASVFSILITLPAGTYTLTIPNPNGAEFVTNPATGDLDITTSIPVTIRGADRLSPAATVIDGNGPVLNDRVFDINPGVNAAVPNVTIQGVTIRNGRAFAGGGIGLTRGTLSLEDSIVRDNGGGGGINFGRLGTLSLRNVTVQGNVGGGIAAVTDTLFVGETFALNINASRIIDNSGAQGGGGIDIVGATTTVRTSTIAGNTATINGGGIRVGDARGGLTVDHSTISGNTVSGQANVGDSGGGGIDNLGATVTVINSTISGNLSVGDGGGIRSREAGTSLGPVVLRNVTIANNVATAGVGTGAPRGGGVGGPSITFRNTLLAGNAVAAGGAGPDCFATAFVSQGFNLIQNGADCNSGTDPTSLTGVDPRLGPLADNGGATQTHVLLADSPALNTANFAAPGSGGTACEATDQRGVVRPQNGRCDIGAVEVAPVGVSHLAQTDSAAAVGEPMRLALTWTHPVRWRELDNLQLRLADDAGVAMWLRFEPAAGTLAPVDPASESAGSGALPGSAAVRETEMASVDLEKSTIAGSGPDGPSVTLAVSLMFKPQAQGRVFNVETLVTDLSGASQGFDPVGTVTVD